MARYCANVDCIHTVHPLPSPDGSCPECGSFKYRLNPDMATVVCPTCDRTNEATANSCWDCGAALNQHRVLR